MGTSDSKSHGPGDDPLSTVIVGVISIVTFTVGFGLLALGVEFFWITFVVGFAGVLPLALGLLEYYQNQETTNESATGEESAEETPLEELRSRYARGELTDEEFERRLDRLLATKTIEDAHRHHERSDERTDRRSRTDASDEFELE